MKKFITSGLLFLVIGLVLLAITGFVSKRVVENIYSPKQFKLNQKLRTLVIGDSGLMGYDPKTIERSINYARGGESYFYNYYKLKFCTENNPQIRNIILSFQCASFSSFFEDKRRLFIRPLNRFYMILDDEGKEEVRSWSKEYIWSTLKYDYGIPVDVFGNLDKTSDINSGRKLNYPFLKKYAPIAKSSSIKLDKIEKAIHTHYYKYNKEANKQELMKRSLLMESYLYKIIAYCKEKDLRLILVNNPLHPEYKKRIPKQYTALYEKVKRRVRIRHPEVEFYDFSELELKDEEYRNGNHVNYHGGQILSKEVNDILYKKKKSKK